MTEKGGTPRGTICGGCTKLQRFVRRRHWCLWIEAQAGRLALPAVLAMVLSTTRGAGSAGAKTLLEGFGATRAQRGVQRQLQIHFSLSSPGLHKPVQKVPVSATPSTSTRLATLGCAWETSLMIQNSAMCPLSPGALTNSQASSSPPSTGALLLVVPATSPQPAPTLWLRGSRSAAWWSRCTGCGTSPPPTQSAETIAALQRGARACTLTTTMSNSCAT